MGACAIAVAARANVASAAEVEAFLELLAGEFEEVVKENIALKDQSKRLQLELDQGA